MKNKPIAIWGTDIEAVKIYYKLEKDGYNVARFFDNNINENTYFLDKPVSKPSCSEVRRYYIFIGCKYHTYRTISDQLEQYGLEEMLDYIWYELYKKKIVILHGNCHMDILRKYLMYTKEFTGGV